MTWEYMDSSSARLVLGPPLDVDGGDLDGSEPDPTGKRRSLPPPHLQGAPYDQGQRSGDQGQRSGGDGWRSRGPNVVPTTATTAPHKSAKVVWVGG